VYRTETIIALGSNLGNGMFNLRYAIRELENLGYIKNFANIYISLPYGYRPQRNFYNTAIKLLTNQQPLELIKNIYEIEKKLKKNKKIINGPRNIDLDIIFFGKQKFNQNNLIIPHPRATERDFVLFPILDIDPFFRHPIEKKSVKVLIRELKNKYIINKLSYRNLI
tara:strand:- start:24 stop:524 length:501 start_codon:yes stop_codon:yes gene_type:complete